MERMDSVAWKGVTGRFRPEQVAQRSTWAVVPDDTVEQASMRTITVVPLNASTCTYVNPLDPGDGPDRNYYDSSESTWGTVIPASRGRY